MRHMERAGTVERKGSGLRDYPQIYVGNMDVRLPRNTHVFSNFSTVNEYKYIHTDALMWGPPQLCCNFLQTTLVQNESWGCTKLGRDRLICNVLDGDGSQEYRLGILVLVICPTNH